MMNLLQSLFPEALVEALAWTLLHTIWQGALIVAALAFVLWLGRNSSAQIRYGASLLALMGMLVWAGITFVNHYEQVIPLTESSQLQHIPILAHDPIPFMDIEGKESASGILALKQWLLEMPNRITPYTPLISALWLFGILFFAIRWVGSLMYLHRLRHYQTSNPSKELLQTFSELCQKMGISRQIQLKKSQTVGVPMVIGHLKPVILIPAGMLTGLSPQQIEAILAHELAHIRRHDFMVNQFLALMEMLFFFHPAFWWMQARVREEREHCCDDVAVSVSGNLMEYVKALADLEEKRIAASTMAMALSGQKNHLLRRIKRLVSPHAVENAPQSRAIPAITLLLTGFCFLCFSPTSAKVLDQAGNALEKCLDGEIIEALIPSPNKKKKEAEKVVLEEEEEIRVEPKSIESIKPELAIALHCTPPDTPRTDELVESITNMTTDIVTETLDMVFGQLDMAKSQIDGARTQVKIELDGSDLSEEEKQRILQEVEGELAGAKREIEIEMSRLADENAEWRVELENAMKEVKVELSNVDWNGEVAEAMEEVRIQMEGADWQADFEEGMREMEKGLREMERGLREAEMEQREVEREMREEERERATERREEARARAEEARARAAEERERSREAEERSREMREQYENLRSGLKSQLIRDGLLDKKGGKVRIVVNAGEIKINGKTFTGREYDKYKRLLEESGMKIGPGSKVTMELD